MKEAPVNTTLALGLISVIMIISMEKMHESALEETHKNGVAVGYKLGQIEVKESLKKQVTDKTCHAWWFDGDTTRAAKSIQKVSIK